jgi:hypothetical protein
MSNLTYRRFPYGLGRYSVGPFTEGYTAAEEDSAASESWQTRIDLSTEDWTKRTDTTPETWRR